MAIVSLLRDSVPLVLFHNLKLIDDAMQNDKSERERASGGKNGEKSAPDFTVHEPKLSRSDRRPCGVLFLQRRDDGFPHHFLL
jgi:hypothetical protein